MKRNYFELKIWCIFKYLETNKRKLEKPHKPYKMYANKKKK